MGGGRRARKQAAAGRYASKAEARRACWDALVDAGAARFPLPPHGRIPNFAGASEAARRLLAESPLASAKVAKVNPDAPQRPLRAALLERGVTLYMPTPRLRGGFMRLDPAAIPAQGRARAAALGRARDYATPVALRDLPQVDAVICGSVAVTEEGRRCGKGEGYSDLEYALLRELGHKPAPVFTTVHELQIARSLPYEPGDLPLHWIATPSRCVEIPRPLPEPDGIDWERLPPEKRRAMPPLDELWRS